MNDETVRRLDRDLLLIATEIDRLHQTLNLVRQELVAAHPKAIEEGPVKILQEKAKAKRDEAELMERALHDRENIEGAQGV